MKKIRKTYSGVVPNGKVLNSRNNSQQDTYSSDYLNRVIPNTNDLGEIIVDDIHCKNIFDGKFRQGNFQGVALTIRLFNANNFKLKAGKTYTFSTNMDLSTFVYAISLNDNTYPTTVNNFYESGAKSTSSFSFTPTKDGYLGITIRKTDANATITLNEISNYWFQIEPGPVTTDYVEHKKFGYNSTDSMGKIVVDDITCKNIIATNIKSQTINGLTITVNSDKTVTIKGTATSDTNIILNNTTYNTTNKIPAGTYTLSGGCQTFIEEGNNQGWWRSETKTFNTDTMLSSLGFYFYVSNGSTVDKTIYLQLEKGPIATDYVPHKEYDNDIVASTLQANINALASKLNVITKNTGSGYTVTFNGTLTDRYIFMYMAILNGGYGVAGTFTLLNGNIINSSKFLDNAEAGTVTITSSTTGFTLKFARNYTTCTIISPDIALN